MSFPACIIAESNLQKFTDALPGFDNYRLPTGSDGDLIELVPNGNRLRIAIIPVILELKGHFQIRWKFKVRLFSSQEESQKLLQNALSKADAVPVESLAVVK